MELEKGLAEKTVLRMKETLKPGQKIRFGCDYGAGELVVIQLSEEMSGNEKLAREFMQIIEKDNIRRAYMGKSIIAYKIATSKELVEQFPDVAEGNFELVKDDSLVQEIDLGHVFFASQPVCREK